MYINSNKKQKEVHLILDFPLNTHLSYFMFYFHKNIKMHNLEIIKNNFTFLSHEICEKNIYTENILSNPREIMF